MQLIFSDEFNTDGRTFWPGDDPYWEAVDLHYWAVGSIATALFLANVLKTNNLNWYDPSTMTTNNGALEITLSETQIHNLNYSSGMMSTWNKFCFTGGLVEVAVTLPGLSNVAGLWPAVWAMGNLGRAGYGASLDGMVSFFTSNLVGDKLTQHSGHTHTIVVMLAPHQIKPLVGNPSYLPEQVISTIITHCHSFQDKGCPGAPVPANLTLDLYIQMGRMLVVRLQKSMSSKRRWANHTRLFSFIDVNYQVDAGVGMVSQSAQWAVSTH